MIEIGARVRVNDNCPVEHLRGDTGIVVAVDANGYIQFTTTYQGWVVDAHHPLEELDVLE